MPLPYYKRLSRRDRAIYRQSAAIVDVPLPDARACRPLADALRQALEQENQAAVEKAAQRLVGRIAYQLRTEPVAVRVLARRPHSETAELHGLYSREEGRRPVIQVWMRTARHERVASFRTFLRTLLHELCHHLDYAHFGLADSFHTEGFFKRESSLVRQLAPKSRGRGRRHRPAPAAASPRPDRSEPPAGAAPEPLPGTSAPAVAEGEGGPEPRQIPLPLG
ncbi:MAG: hypothetical protein ACODAU_04845 [Myxococcota bacterium]